MCQILCIVKPVYYFFFSVTTLSLRALSGSDYQEPANLQLTFSPGQHNLYFFIAILNDDLLERNDTFTVNISTTDAVTIVNKMTTITIIDDEQGMKK
jgi:hypothetical protein